MIKKIPTILKNPKLGFIMMIIKCRSYFLTKRFVTQGKGKIILQAPFLKVKIKKAKNAQFILNGNLIISPHLSGTTPVVIILGKNSSLTIENEFIIGNGVKISLSENSKLYFGGKNKESASGITADILIMVSKNIEIGSDFICAWGVYITDSDWHDIEGQIRQKDVIIGDHVWIANNSSVLKGSQIGHGSVVAGASKVHNKVIPPESLVAGTRGEVVKNNIKWKR